MQVTVSKLKSTIMAVFQQLERSGLRYAVLRNYDHFPDFGHDVDLVMHADDLDRWRKLLVETARQEGWEALVECRHWHKSKRPHNNIEIFRFYNAATAEFLQFDLFHGYPLLSLPLIGEEELLASMVPDDRGFKRIDPALESLHRLLQVERLYAIQRRETPKIARYRERIIHYLDQDPVHFEQVLCRYLGADAARLIPLLKKNDWATLAKMVRRLKIQYLLNHTLKAPVSTLNSLLERISDYRQAFFTDSCGFILDFHAASESESARLFSALETLKQANFFPDWRCQDTNPWWRLRWKERFILERGGIVIQWVSPAHAAEIDVSEFQTPELLQMAMVRQMVNHHQVLFEGVLP